MARRVARRGFPSGSSEEYVEELRELRGRRVVVDVGAGRGGKARWLAARGNVSFVVEIDVEPRYLASQVLGNLAAIIERVVAAAERLPIRSEAVDAILAWNVLMWTEMAEALREMARVAEENAKLVASLYKVKTGRPWTYEETRRMVEEAGFRVEREKRSGHQYRLVAVKEEKKE